MSIHLVKFAPNVDGIIEDLVPGLQAILHMTAAASFVKWAKPLILTSVWREPLHDGDIHALHRAFDFDVDDRDKYSGLQPDEALALSELINKYAIYDPTRPYLKCALYGHDDPNDRHWNHVHVQVHPRTTISDPFLA